MIPRILDHFGTTLPLDICQHERRVMSVVQALDSIQMELSNLPELSGATARSFVPGDFLDDEAKASLDEWQITFSNC